MKQTHTPKHSMRIPDELWTAARNQASRQGITVTDVVRSALKAYAYGADVSADQQERTD